MTKKELVNAIATEAGLSIKDSGKALTHSSELSEKL